jgi:hypothetical protein
LKKVTKKSIIFEKQQRSRFNPDWNEVRKNQSLDL